jgi:general secretion pathway protein A
MSLPAYRAFFGFTREPFTADLPISNIMTTPQLTNVADRFDYVVRLGAVGLVTGDVGSGKSTALRWAASRLHPTEYHILWVTASGGSILELYRLLTGILDAESRSFSRAVLTRIIRSHILDLVAQKRRPVLIIDEASLLRVDTLAELHTLCQFEGDAKPILPIILAGQNNLADLLTYHTSLPLASRVTARSHLVGITREEMARYLTHHLAISGVASSLFADQAVTAIHQGSGGLLRRANHLARGSLIAAASEQCLTVAAEHVRLAATELI